ncbi:MAG: hypothetical protein ABFD97_10420 [Syntrophobacter sp.]
MYPNGTVVYMLFWMAIGIFQICIYNSINYWTKRYNPNSKWWQVALLYCCVLSFFIVVFAGFTLKGEYEGNAGWYMIGSFGVMHVIAGAALVKLFVLKNTKKKYA